MRRLAMCNIIIRWAINIDVPYLQSNLVYFYIASGLKEVTVRALKSAVARNARHDYVRAKIETKALRKSQQETMEEECGTQFPRRLSRLFFLFSSTRNLYHFA